MCGLDSVAVARCFFKHSYGFAIYTQYCTNYPRTVSILTDLMRNSETAEVFKERQIALCHNLPLGSYLLKPVQRILRYRLLLENIVKTSNQDCEGYADIKNALSVMTGIAYHINDMKKRHENAVRVQEIQSLLYGWDGQDLTTYGELVAEGAFRMYRTKTLRHLFLFDKMLLIAKKKEEGILCYKTHIMCSNLMLIESIQGEPVCFHVIPFDNPREQHTFQARNTEQKREWCLQLKRVILENYNAVIPSHARQLVMELGQSRQGDSVTLEKSSSKRQLSAPEYLEKRKQERRKSESSIKPFKLKKGAKKVSSCERHSHQSLSASYDGTVISEEAKPHSRWRRASVDALPGKSERTNKEVQRNFRVPSYTETSMSDSEKRSNVRFPFHFKGYSSEKERLDAGKRLHKSLPEETTDTENDDLLDFKPPPQTLNVSEEMDDRTDVGGEYVTFYFANSHARQNQQREIITPVITIEDSYDDGYCTLSPNMFLPDPTSSLYASQSFSKVSNGSGGSSDSHKTSNIDLKISADYDNLVDLWTRLGSIKVNCCDADNVSECSVNSPALRRVQSFTEMEKQSFIAQHAEKNPRSSSFMESSDMLRSKDSHFNTKLQFPISADTSSISPTPWLSEQEEYASSSPQKSVSLPWSFHIRKEPLSLSVPLITFSAETQNQWTNTTASLVGDRSQVAEAADRKGREEDFVTDLERYIKSSQEKKQNSCFPINEKGGRNASYSSRASTLYDSTASINSTNINHKIYQQEEKSSSVKNMLCSMSSKLSSVKVSQESSSEVFSHRSISCDGSSNKSNEVIPMGTKFVQSLGKAYSVMKQKHKGNRNPKLPKSQVLDKNDCIHKLGSSVIGARVAYPLDSEYCMLDNFLPLRRNRDDHEESSRPDSLLSASSNVTSSSDSDRMLSSFDFSCGNLPNYGSGVGQEGFHASSGPSIHSESTCSSIISLSSLPKTPYSPLVEKSEFIVSECLSGSNAVPPNSLPNFLTKDVNSDYGITSTLSSMDSPSDRSDVSGDSYYEKTFEAIENVLAEEMFRDSAIYSDPDDLDLNALTRKRNLSSNINDRNELMTTAIDNTESAPFTNFSSILNITGSAPVNQDEPVSSACQHQRNNLFTRPVNKNIVDKLECLKNQNCSKNVVASASLKGLKSIRERWKELEQWQNSSVGVAHSEPDNFSVISNIPDDKVNTNTNTSDENILPKGKGWVKHVVSKLQNEKS